MADESLLPAAHPMRSWGPPGPGETVRVVVVSPHLDDAVLSCGRLLAAHPGAVVVTVFTGNPDRYPEPMRDWDVWSGFGPGDDVMAVRRGEDERALAVLGATGVHLGFVEHTYRTGDRPVEASEIVDVLLDALTAADPTVVVAPFGLGNPDHDVTHDACMLARERFATASWWCYEDTGYKHIPGLLAWRVSRLFRAGVWPTPVAAPLDPTEDRKRTALSCYPSQLRALEIDWALSRVLGAPEPEQCWRLAPPPPGWEGLAEV